MNKIILSDLEFVAKHGVYEQEKIFAQPFIISLTMETNLDFDKLDDNIEKTINYVLIYEQVKSVVEDHSYNLIETLANEIAKVVLEDHRIKALEVTVRKPQAQIGSAACTAVVQLRKENY